MDNPLYTLDVADVAALSTAHQEVAAQALESGQVVYFPHYAFKLEPTEDSLLSDSILKPKTKNISYDTVRDNLAGLADSASELEPTARAFMHRYAEFARQLVDTLLPAYREELRWGRTSFRPAEIKGRKSSKRKDDTRLHVDAFPSTPVNELRILRVFCNVNPYGEPRVWHLGEPFHQVLSRFAPHIPPYSALTAKLLQLIKATKTLRTAYDHTMLQLHDRMKLDEHYQQSVTKHRMDFPAGSTWLVFTDQASHAALSGQFLLEQTFYLPVEAMANPEKAPAKLIAAQTKKLVAA